MQEHPKEGRTAKNPDPFFQLLAAGDEAAWAAFDRKLRPRLLAIAERLLRRRPRAGFEAEDVVQNALLRAHQGLKSLEYRDARSLRAWLLMLLSSSLTDARRRDGRLRRSGRRVGLEEGAGAIDLEQEARARARELRMDLATGLAQLTHRKRWILWHRFVLQRPRLEVAEELHLSIAQARVFERTAIRKLRSHLRELRGGVGS